jgi:hypothetical protein
MYSRVAELCNSGFGDKKWQNERPNGYMVQEFTHWTAGLLPAWLALDLLLHLIQQIQRVQQSEELYTKQKRRSWRFVLSWKCKIYVEVTCRLGARLLAEVAHHHDIALTLSS